MADRKRLNELKQKQQYTAEDLREIIHILRDPADGCPWDKVQTHASIRKNFLEEAYEAVDALDFDDAELMREELGDVLMQVMFHICIEQERGRFDWQDVCTEVCRKLIRRHPHIFEENSDSERITDWELLKIKEKGRTSLAKDLDDVPKAMPQLVRAEKLQKRAEKHGCAFYADTEQIKQLSDRADAGEVTEKEIGRLLFEVVSLARKNGIDAEQGLERFNQDFLEQTSSEETQNYNIEYI